MRGSVYRSAGRLFADAVLRTTALRMESVFFGNVLEAFQTLWFPGFSRVASS